MTPSFRERLRDKLDKYYGSDLNDKIDKTWDEVQEQAVAEILSLVEAERTTAYKAGMERIIELVDSPDFYVKPREQRSEYLRTEANKEIK